MDQPSMWNALAAELERQWNAVLSGDEVFSPVSIALALVISFLILAVLMRKDSDLPGPTQWPVLQCVLEAGLINENSIEYLRAHTEKYRDEKTGLTRAWTFKLPLMPRMIFLPLRPDVYRHVLRDKFDIYPKGPQFQANLQELLGAGIFNSDGHVWKIQRKTSSHLFSRAILRDTMQPIFVKHSQLLVDALNRAAKGTPAPGTPKWALKKAGSGGGGVPLDFHDLMYRFTLDSIGEIAFGISVESLKIADVPFLKAFDAAQEVMLRRFFDPVYPVTEVVMGTRRTLDEAVRTIDDFCLGLVRSRRSSGAYMTGQDVLSRFMRLKDEAGNMTCLNDDKLLRDVVLNFIIAGRDTTAQLLSWTVYCLVSHPKVQAKLQSEIDKVLADKDAPDGLRIPTFDDANGGLPYTRNVLREALRLFPSVAKDAKQAAKDDVLPDGTKVRAGEMVIYSPHCMCREPAVWGKDADVFRPERWEGMGEPDPFMYPVFNAGPRTCLGKEMALQEAITALATIYGRFNIFLDPHFPIPRFGNALTLPVQGGLWVVTTPRRT